MTDATPDCAAEAKIAAELLRKTNAIRDALGDYYAGYIHEESALELIDEILGAPEATRS